MKKSTSSPKKLTPCICPRCETKHKMRLFWIGKLPAKKYCRTCGKLVEEIDRCSIGDIVNLVMRGKDVAYHLSKRERS